MRFFLEYKKNEYFDEGERVVFEVFVKKKGGIFTKQLAGCNEGHSVGNALKR